MAEINALTTTRTAGKVVGSMLGSKLETALNVGLWNVAKAAGIRGLIADTFASIEDAELSEISSISPKGILDVIEKFIDATVLLAPIIGDEIAGELFGEMIQEGVSNAIQTSLGGAIQTIFNIRRGAYPAMQDYPRYIGQAPSSMDLPSMAILTAMCGSNVITTVFDLVYGANQEIENRLRYLSNAIENLQNNINTHAIGIIMNLLVDINVLIGRIAHMPLEVALVWHETIRRICEEHLARVNELEDTLESLKMYYDEGIVEDETLISLEMLKVKAELQATQQSLETFLQSASNAYDDTIQLIQNQVETVIGNLKTAIDEIFNKLYNILESAKDISDVDVSSDLSTIISDIVALLQYYRNFDSPVINVS